MAAAGEEGRKPVEYLKRVPVRLFRRPVTPVLGAIGTILFLAGFVWLWWHWVPVLYQGFNGITEPERLTATTNTRAALLAGLVGIGALGTFWLNSRAQRFMAENLRLTEENLRLTKNSQEENFRLAERGHLADRYTKAIELLGDDKLEIRLGGIYALERLAGDSERDHPTVVEVLGSFVRERTNPARSERPTVADVLSAALKILEPKDGQPTAPDENPLSEPPKDVQTAITVLGQLRTRPGVHRGDLWGANLTNMHLFNANMAGAYLYKVNLTNVNLAGTNLTKASLQEANLTKAYLKGANLTKAYLLNADLTEAVLFKADLSGARCVTQDQLEVARGDSSTKIPAGLRRPASWPDAVEPDVGEAAPPPPNTA